MLSRQFDHALSMRQIGGQHSRQFFGEAHVFILPSAHIYKQISAVRENEVECYELESLVFPT